MKTGIVVLNYRSKELTDNLVKKIVNYGLIQEIVIVDNFSGDDFTEIAEMYEKVTYLSNMENSGYAKGNNIGLRYLYEQKQCEYAFIANPDVIFEEETIEKIVNFLSTNKEYAIASSKRYSVDGVKMGQYWSIPDYKECLFESFYLYRKRLAKNYAIQTTRQVYEQTKGEFVIVDVVPGAFFGINLKIISKLNYLDENTFLYYEENILAQKIKKRDYKSAILTNCEYQHNHKKGSGANKAYKFLLKSKLYYVKEYLKCGKFKVLLLRLGNTWLSLEKKILSIFKK